MLDVQAALPAAGRASASGERRDYAALAGLAGHGHDEYERLDPRRRREARAQIDRELAMRRSWRRGGGSGGASTGGLARMDRAQAHCRARTGRRSRRSVALRRAQPPDAPRGGTRLEEWKREGAAAGASHSSPRRTGSSVLDDAREVAARRKCQSGSGSPVIAGSVTARRVLPGGAVAVSVGASLGLAAVFMLIVVVAGMGDASLSAAGGGDVSGSGDGTSALALRDIPPEYLRLYQAAGARYGARLGDLGGDRQGRVRPRARPRPLVHARGRRQLGGRGWADAVHRLDLGDLRRGRRRGRSARSLGPRRRDLRRRRLPPRLGRARQLSLGDLRLQPRKLVCRRGAGWAAKSRAPPNAPVGRGGAEGGEGSEGGEGIEGADTRLPGETATPVRFIAGERAMLTPGDGHVALVPAGVPAIVQAMVVAGNEIQTAHDPTGHPDPRGATDEDCSSTVNYVLYRSGVRPIAEIVRDNPLAQDTSTGARPALGAG